MTCRDLNSHTDFIAALENDNTAAKNMCVGKGVESPYL